MSYLVKIMRIYSIKKTTKAYKKAPKNAKRNEDRKTESFEKL